MLIPTSAVTAPMTVTETKFPCLDTFFRAPGTDVKTASAEESTTEITNKREKRDTSIPAKTCRLNQTAIHEAYARFIAEFTGSGELSFHASLTHDAGDGSVEDLTTIHYFVAAQVEEGLESNENKLEIEQTEIANGDQPHEVAVDFAIHIHVHQESNELTDEANAIDTVKAPFILLLQSSDGEWVSNVTIYFQRELLKVEDSEHMLRTIITYLNPDPSATRTRHEPNCTARSILNFPPLQRPPILLQDAAVKPLDQALLHSAFERRASSHPDTIALDFLDAQASPRGPAIHRIYTYAELDRLTTLLARRILASPGVVGHSVAPVLLTTSPELYISYLAILKAGLAFSPLPLEAPPNRIKTIVLDLSPKVILGSKSSRDRFPMIDGIFESQHTTWIDVEKFCVEQAQTSIVFDDNAELASQTKESNVAYVMYTSGTTGKPKGVQITHLSASCSIAAHAIVSPLPPAKDGVPKWFQFAAPTFDPSLMEIFVTLSTGATLCSAARDITLTDTEGAVSELGATVMMATPSMAALLRRAKLPTLNSLWTMGETLLRKNIDDFAISTDDQPSQLVNAYGPTEGSINCTLLPDFNTGDRGSIIGPELPTCSLFIIDPNLKDPTPVPRGFAGELAIGGPQVSIGYINRPEENAKAFVESQEFGRLYRTGDKARLVTDRSGRQVIDFLGRINSSQVKMSGRRVDLGEIDAVIAAVGGVKECVTVTFKRSPESFGSEEAVTFIVQDEASLDNVEELCRQAAADQLPAYMCPSRYFFVSQIPRSMSGKVDRKILTAMVNDLWVPLPEVDTASLDDLSSHITQEVVIPSGNLKSNAIAQDVENTLRRILVALVGTSLENITATTSLFSLGIDSLRAIRFLQQARDVGVTELSIADVLQKATSRAMAALVATRRENAELPTSALQDGQNHEELLRQFASKHLGTTAKTFNIDSEEIENVFPTTATQSGMLASFLRSSHSPHKHYIHHSVHHINHSIDSSNLQAAWLNVLARHEAYRMIFCQVDDPISPFLQCVLRPECNLAQLQFNITKCEDNELDGVVSETLLKAEGSIDITRPPVSLTIISSPSQRVVTLSIFHGIFDGASLQLLFEEVEAAYYDLEIPKRTGISTAVKTHYAHQSDTVVQYWQDLLKDCEPEPFPCLTGMRSESFRGTPTATTVRSEIDINALRDSAKLNASSPLAILQAAWALLLATYKGSKECATFGSVISGRLDSDSTVCVGPTFTTIPVTLPAAVLSTDSDSMTNSHVLQTLTSSNASSLAHLQIPLNSVVASNKGLHYDTLLAFQDFSTSARSSRLWNSVDYPPMGNDFAVMIEVWPEGDGQINLRATYTDTYLDQDSAKLMLEQFSDITQFIVQNPDVPFWDGKFASTPSMWPVAASNSSPFPIIPEPVITSASITSQSLAVLAKLEPDHSLELLHHLFEKNAAENPDDVALIFKNSLDPVDFGKPPGDIEWTYRELNEKADRLSQYLVKVYGKMNGKIIPFSLHKCPQLYIAVLAILKSGGAWCPIDPAFPTQRRHDLIARTDAEILLAAGGTNQQESGLLPAGVTLVDIDIVMSQTLESPVDVSPPRAEDMAYLIWTSGTTGLPKGVQVSHNAAAQAMRSLRLWISKSADDSVRCLQFSQPTFDVFVEDLFYTWGLRGVVISATKAIMLGSFANLANQTKATHAHLTPAFATIIPRQTCKTLEVVTMIGEALPQVVADDWSQSMVGAYNTYGPAEAAVVSTVKQFGGCENSFKSTNVGIPLSSVGAYVLKDGRPVMQNGVGELALAGPQLANGYWKDESKTKEKFFYSEHVQQQIYLTGDIVRQLHEGSFEFVGRRDDLIKIAGQRVELSEISFAVDHAHPDIEQVVSVYIGRKDRPAKAVVVFVSVPKLLGDSPRSEMPYINEQAIIVANAVTSEAQKTLPDHMIPSAIVIIASIPVTPSAKIDRNSLARSYELLDLELWERTISSSVSFEWTPEEEKLLNHISSFSGISSDTISRSSRLAALGIDSIGVIRFTARLKHEGYNVSAADLLQCRSVLDLCTVIAADGAQVDDCKDISSILEDFDAEWHARVASYLDVSEASSFSVMPSLPLQENLLSESFKNHTSYWSNHFFELSEDIDLSRLQKAWATVALNNQALRVGFVPKAAVADTKFVGKIASTFLQVLYGTPIVGWSCEHLGEESLLTATTRQAEAISLKHQQASFVNPCWAVTIFEGNGSTMMFTVHHSIHDGPSLGYIMYDLANAYAGTTEPIARNQLGNAVAASTVARTSDEADLAFWKSALKDYVIEEDITQQDTSTRKSPGHHEKRLQLSLPYSASELQNLVRRLQCSSVASILRIAWACIVADFLESEEKKVVMGEVFSERMEDRTFQDVIGPMVSLIAVPFSAYGTTADLLAQSTKIMSRSRKHRHVNPGVIRKLIRRPKNQPLHAAVFVFHPYDESREVNNTFWTELEDQIGLSVEHDLVLNVEQMSDGSLDLVVSANVGTLSADGLDLLVQQVNALTNAMINHPDIPVSELTNHFPVELISITGPRELLLDAVVSLENPLCWLEHWANVSPDWPAVEVAQVIASGTTKTEKWSYAQLNNEAERVSVFIQSRNIRGRIIGVCLGRTLTSFAVIVGIFKSGNAYLPIEEDLPLDRKTFLLQDSDSPMCFTTGEINSPSENCSVVRVETDVDFLSTKSSSKSSITGRSKNDPAYLLYTSGSTGNPKGVFISLGNLTSFCEAQSEFICACVPVTLKLGGVGKYLALASRAFDVHVAEMFLAWRWGLTCVTALKSMLLDDLPLALQELRVTHASFVPSLLDQVGLTPEDVPLLKYMGVGGEKISQRTLEVWGDSTSAALINAYGPTEVTIGCASARVNSKANLRNIGKPLGDLVAHVLVPGTLNYAKRGMEGELCFTGSLVGIGYHNRDLPAFVKDFHGSKMYRTGDLVRLMADDTIEIFGRADDQTKIRGQRLELGEVSACVRSFVEELEGVATVITKHPGLSRMQLVSFAAYSKRSSREEACIVLDSFQQANSTIRQGCKEKLPAYMVPDVVVPINYLPIAPNSGKADMKQLKAIFSSIPLQTLVSSDHSASSTSLDVTRNLNEDEDKVVELLQRLIEVDVSTITPSTNIFELGIDSLAAISLSAQLRKAGCDCSVAAIMDLATIEDLALLCGVSQAGTRNDDPRSLAQTEERKEFFAGILKSSEILEKFGTSAILIRPSMPLQEAMVARSLNDESETLYVNHIILELSESTDAAKLSQAWSRAFYDNEILRTCFTQINDDILQVVVDPERSRLSFTSHTVDGEDILSVVQEKQSGIAKDIVQNIQNCPPIRINTFQSTSSTTKTFLCLSMHHALYDAQSLTILLEDVSLRYYEAKLPDRPSAGALVDYVDSQSTERAEKYWMKALEDFVCPIAAELIPEEEGKTYTVARIVKKRLSVLETCASQLKVTLPALSQLVFGLALAKVKSVDDFVFGLVLSGRTVPITGMETLLAPTITTVPQRVDLRQPDATVLRILADIQNSSGKILKYQHTSLRSIHRWVDADRPLFDCLLSYIKTGPEVSGEHLWKEVESYMPSDYPFAVEFHADPVTDNLTITAASAPGAWAEKQVQNLLEMVESLLTTITDGGNPTIKSLGIESNGISIALNVESAGQEEEWSASEMKIKQVIVQLTNFEDDHVSKHSTFFRLGIDSVVAIRLATKLRASGLKVSSSDILRYPTIALLSAHIVQNVAPVVEAVAPEGPADKSSIQNMVSLLSSEDSILEIYNCTPLQSGLLTQTIASGGQIYVHHPTVRLANDTNTAQLKTAWTAVVNNHDILRTTFHLVEGVDLSWSAAVHSAALPYWLEVDVQGETEIAVADIVKATKFQDQNSFSKPPVRVTILNNSTEKVMVLTLHHSLYDGWALPLIFNALEAAYKQEAYLEPTPFYQAARLINSGQDASVDFWLQKIDRYRGINIPLTVSDTSPSASFASFTVDMPVSDILEKCKSLNTTLYAATLLAFSKLLSKILGQRDVVFGRVVSGRTLPLYDVESVVGPLFNTIPCRITLDNPLATNEDVVGRVQKSIVDEQSHEHASLNHVLKQWRKENTNPDVALFDALFVFQKASSATSITEPLWTALDLQDDRNATEYGLNVECLQGDHDVIFSVSSSGRLNPQELQALCENFDIVLKDILNAPSRSVVGSLDSIAGLTSAYSAAKTQQAVDFTEAAASPFFESLRKILSDVAQVPLENIQAHTSIYAIGVDSIAAIRVAAMARRQSVDVSVADVLQGRTVGGILQRILTKPVSSALVREIIHDVPADIKTGILSSIRFPESSVEQILPCLAGQIYHLASWLKTGRTSYEPTWSFLAESRLDSSRLAKAWTSLQIRHGILRTIFANSASGHPHQVILRTDAIDTSNFEVIQTLTDLEFKVKELARQFAANPSDVFTPAIKLCLVQGPEADAILVKVHHSLYDAWTMTKMVDELSALYVDQPLESIADFPGFVWHMENTVDNDAEIEFWKSTLSVAQPTLLSCAPAAVHKRSRSARFLSSVTKILKFDASVPVKKAQPPLKQTFVWVKQGVTDISHMRKQCQANELALSTIIILAFGHVLAKVTKTTNPTFGFFQTGRSSSFPGCSTIPGPCVNLLPLTTQISPHISDNDSAAAIQNHLISRIPYEQSHLQRVLQIAQGNNSTPAPLFNASLNLLWHTTGNGPSTDEKPLLSHLPIGVPSDFASEYPIEGTTAVDGLETGYLAAQNLFVDVGPVPETDSLDFGVKCDDALMGEEKLREFISELCIEIKRIVDGLPVKLVR